MNYLCPKCHSQYKIHNFDCRWADIDMHNNDLAGGKATAGRQKTGGN